MRLLALIFLIAVVPIDSTGQATVKIKSGAYWVVDGSPRIVLKDISFQNDGTFTSDLERLIVRGTSATASTTLGTPGLYELEIDKSSNGLTLATDLTITNQLILTSGHLDLGTSKLTLDGASIVGESATNFITGGTGQMEMTMSVNAPSQLDPGNIGIQLTSSANLGNTTFIRGHDPRSDGWYEGIERYITINPTNNSGLNATLRMYYSDSELNGLVESDLEFYRYNGSVWSNEGVTSRNTTDNWVELTGINAFSTWTLSTSSNPLPVELIGFDAKRENGKVILEWSTSTEINNDYFIVEKSTNALDYSALAQIKGNGNSTQAHSYSTTDDSPLQGIIYYKLKQVDFDNSVTILGTKVIHIDDAFQKGIHLYPNPVTDYISIRGYPVGTEINLKLYQLNGRLINRKQLTVTNEATLSLQINPGNYIIQIEDVQGKQLHSQLITVR